MIEEQKQESEDDGLPQTESVEVQRNKFSPLYQIVYNVVRFANSKRWKQGDRASGSVPSANQEIEEEKKGSLEDLMNTSQMSTFYD